MKYSSLLLLFCFLAGISPAQSDRIKSAEQELVQCGHKLSGLDPWNWDSLEYYSDAFDSLMRVKLSDPLTLDYDFKMLTDSGYCLITTSPDKQLRIYSWDTRTGGTMHFYHSIFQYRSSDGVKLFIPDQADEDPGSLYFKMYTLKCNDKTIYLPVSLGVFSTKYMAEIISSFRIEDNKLDAEHRIFQSEEGLSNRLFVEYDFFSVFEREERPILLSSYDEKRRVLYLPETDDQMKVKDQLIEYKFNGAYFERGKSKSAKSK